MGSLPVWALSINGNIEIRTSSREAAERDRILIPVWTSRSKFCEPLMKDVRLKGRYWAGMLSQLGFHLFGDRENGLNAVPVARGTGDLQKFVYLGPGEF